MSYEYNISWWMGINHLETFKYRFLLFVFDWWFFMGVSGVYGWLLTIPGCLNA